MVSNTAYLKVSLLLATLLVAFPASAQQRSDNDINPTVDSHKTSQLPELEVSRRPDQNVSITSRNNGVNLHVDDAGSKFILAPEYSNQTSLAITTGFAALLGDRAALGLLLTIGAEKQELLINAGYRLDEHQQIIVSVGELKQRLDFAFPSGNEKTTLTQNSGGLSYQLQLGRDWLQTLEINAYMANTASRDLADKYFAVDTPTLFELWSDQRRIAGGKIAGAQGRIGFSPLSGSTVKLSLGQERLSYDLFAGNESSNSLTGGIEWAQQLDAGYRLRTSADRFASQDRYTLGIERSLADTSGRHSVGFDLISIRGRDGVGNDNQIRFAYSYTFGGSNASLASLRSVNNADGGAQIQRHGDANPGHAGNNAALLDQVILRPGYMPSHVIAKVDQTAQANRLIAVNKAALPAGASISPTTGDITVPLPAATTGIGSITKNGAAFANTGQFVLSGTNFVVKPSLIAEPAVGVTDTYLVTINNAGGGTTLATVVVSHGSVKIDSITLSQGSPDATPPITTAAPSVSDTTPTATVLSVSINENGTGYYLVQDAVAAAPSVATVQSAGTSFAMMANVMATLNISGLAPSTNYKIYFVAKDAANNVQGAVSSVAVTTTALPAGYVYQGGLTWMAPTFHDNWGNANAYCAGTTINGQTGWRLATDAELSALYTSGATNGKGWYLSGYWSSTSSPTGTHYMVVNLMNGFVLWVVPQVNNVVTCVR